MIDEKETKENFNRLFAQMGTITTEESLTTSRNFALGGAAVCLAVLVQILQVGAN